MNGKYHKQPKNMSDDTYEALLMMLRSPWYKWHKACEMHRPILPWKYTRFKHCVDVTKMAIRSTLSYEFYPESYIPNVRVEKIGQNWSLDVQVWGKPDIQKV